ncbi:2OG-Fe dioxygenase family protein [Caballeronia sp. BR00000012568055]|uniref:2OG-Fe dioxygenase family protein n=1 Tax=Caballeronia sp. BR00000012568055 TaxID=2918761 RepID=UPI0023F64CC6|nr:2OG-Fe dioxygenase family protein [Caballeronia sp. BR00000012568055]
MNPLSYERATITQPGHFKSHGYAIINTPPLSGGVAASFDNMPRDTHSPGRFRQIRLSQYFGYHEEGQWIFALLPKRKYIQSAAYIRLAEAGGVMRHREQLECDPSPVISAVLEALGVDQTVHYQINVNQIRVIANGEFKGVTVPEGPHRDGHEFSVIVVAKRHNVTGGETQVIDPASRDIVYRQVLGENQAVLIDDERYIHYATDVKPAHGTTGYRDIWVIEINRWDKRAYGPAHERLASETKLPAELAL